ncbi:MAG: hypothetical protein B6229_06770 [Spirochaetaceae bacterium 4572_7]|nr:MAG: hypothetical protein B6229_06770 [Spirochaetaceae bacterium 4572_7]
MKSLLSGHDYYFEYYFFDNIISIFKKDIIFLSIFLNAIIKDEKAMLVFLSMKEEFSKCFYETVLNLKITQKEKDIIQKLTYTVLESH